MGMSTMTVAVFDIHMESSAVASMNPSTRRRGWPPTAYTMDSAMRLCTPEACSPNASRKPPRKRKMVARP